MSLCQNQNLRFWQDVVAKLRRAHYQLCPDDKQLSNQEQTETIADGFGLMLMMWTDLISFPLSRGQVQNLVHLLEMIPVSETVGYLKRCDSGLIEEIQKTDISSFDDFKHRMVDDSPRAVGLIAPARGLWNEMRDADNRALTAQALHTYFSFITRLNIRGRDDLQVQAREKFLEREILLSQQYFYTSEEQYIIESWFPNVITTYEWIYGKWIPKHGDGSIADRKVKDLTTKYLALGIDEGIENLDCLVGGIGYPRSRKDFRRISKVQFVPKSVDKLRTICMEPSTLMFYQQGFQRSIVSYFRHNRYLARRLDLEHAELNRKLAQRGSISGKYATIDLSDASDSISWRLVRQWFSQTPIFDALRDTRSTHFMLGQEIKPAEKFAPMGSALCFPVMCIVFAAICEAAIRDSGGDPLRSNYRVYGDDIIIESKYAPAVIHRLEVNGFTVNTAKSFIRVSPHNFRESCGGEYLDGEEITPYRISRRFSGTSMVRRSSSRYEALIELANDSYYHFPTVRNFVISELLKLPRQLRPLFSDELGRGGLISDCPTNFHSESKWSPRLCRIRYRYGVGRAHKGVIDLAYEDIRFYEWLRSYCDRSPRVPLSEGRVFIAHRLSKSSTLDDLLVSKWD